MRGVVIEIHKVLCCSYTTVRSTYRRGRGWVVSTGISEGACKIAFRRAPK